jgi:hypothetical protein
VVMNLPCTMVPFFNPTFIVHPCSITKTPCSKLQGVFQVRTAAMQKAKLLREQTSLAQETDTRDELDYSL